jgi:hypothetical protein
VGARALVAVFEIAGNTERRWLHEGMRCLGEPFWTFLHARVVMRVEGVSGIRDGARGEAAIAASLVL